MRAARIQRLGSPPDVGEVAPAERTDGRALIAVTAVALNPLDLAVANGRFYGGSPPLPYTPGCEAVGRVLEGDSLDAGARVYISRDGLGLQRDGTLAERATVSEEFAIPLPAEVDDRVAVALGIAGLAGWAAVTRRADLTQDDRVLVLGATGTAGAVAVQTARLLGARRIVAAGRRPERLSRALELGADTAVRIEDPGDLTQKVLEAFEGAGPTVIVDPLWGAPLVAALAAAAPNARVVHIGQSAGAEATLASSVVRGKQVELRGYSIFATPPDVQREVYLELIGHAAAGRIAIDVETFELERVADAWQRQADGSGAKVVVEI